MTLAARAWTALVALVVAMGLVLFVVADSARYWSAWAYLVIFGGVSGILTLQLVERDRALLERRMHGGPTAERRPAQKLIMLGTSIGFIALLVVPALDHRFGWSTVPGAVIVVADVIVLLGFVLIGRVYRENTFSAATIQIASNQTVVSTGPYAIVRHPMYVGGLLYLGATPLALGSYWGLIAFAAILPLLIWRILDEERYLARELPGYDDYERQVRYRLVPFVW
jgi:protein-S-isoprenylcysteine O-methyltransferase Ste14